MGCTLIREIVRYRFLLWQLVMRDYKVRYKRSILGVLWSLLNPLMTMLVLTLVFSSLFRFDIPNYPTYLISGQIVFSFFSESTSQAMTAISQSGSIIKRIKVPNSIFPLSRCISSFINMLFSMLALIFTMLLTGAAFHVSMLLLPLPLLFIFVFSVGIGQVLCVADVFFKDVAHLYRLFLTALAYATPIFYPASIIPEKFRLLLLANPLAHLIGLFRGVAIFGEMPSISQAMLCAGMSLLSLLLGTAFFNKRQEQFMLYV